jgi:hypothetical protein
MNTQRFLLDTIPERFVEVDAARLLLILVRFARLPDASIEGLRCFPTREIVSYFTPEYYLQKLDFLLRYPGYFAYELTELYRLGRIEHADRNDIIALVRSILSNNEPEMLTIPFRKFWRGAYERLDEVEAWWYGRQLIYTGLDLRKNARPQKYYFLTQLAISESERLVSEVPHGRWYADRTSLIYRFFGSLTPGEVMGLQYSHAGYRQAHLDGLIPDLSFPEIAAHFATVFGEPLGIAQE